MAPPTNAVNGAQSRPTNSLYCSNLNDKLPKDDLKKALYMLFSTYGTILDITALKTMKMRGQAHILYRDVQASTQAMRALQGFEFFGKEMKIVYAAEKSNTLAKLDGTYRQPDLQAANAPTTALQQSIFAGPPGSSTAAPPASLQPPPSLAPPVSAAPVNSASPSDAATPASQGMKRARDESEEEEDDDEAAMDESD